VRGERARGKIGTLAWKPRMEGFEVEGARVNVVCEVPAVWERRSGKKVLLVHGNPSWSFMWRDVCFSWSVDRGRVLCHIAFLVMNSIVLSSVHQWLSICLLALQIS